MSASRETYRRAACLCELCADGCDFLSIEGTFSPDQVVLALATWSAQPKYRYFYQVRWFAAAESLADTLNRIYMRSPS